MTKQPKTPPTYDVITLGLFSFAFGLLLSLAYIFHNLT